MTSIWQCNLKLLAARAKYCHEMAVANPADALTWFESADLAISNIEDLNAKIKAESPP
jgi:hypothetical protein